MIWSAWMSGALTIVCIGNFQKGDHWWIFDATCAVFMLRRAFQELKE